MQRAPGLEALLTNYRMVEYWDRSRKKKSDKGGSGPGGTMVVKGIVSWRGEDE